MIVTPGAVPAAACCYVQAPARPLRLLMETLRWPNSSSPPVSSICGLFSPAPHLVRQTSSDAPVRRLLARAIRRYKEVAPEGRALRARQAVDNAMR